MKVVINNCFGGFGLSKKGIAEYCKLIGKPVYFYEQKKYRFQDGVDEYVKVDLGDKKDSFLTYSLHTDLGENFNEFPDSAEWFHDSEIPREDKNLVGVVEKLGKMANGKCASLKIVEIPDGTQYEISEYDGNEHIAEKHKTWY